MPDIGEVLYDSYRRTGLEYEEKPLPMWEHLSEADKQDWRYAAEDFFRKWLNS